MRAWRRPSGRTLCRSKCRAGIHTSDMKKARIQKGKLNHGGEWGEVGVSPLLEAASEPQAHSPGG